jgi:5'(3')-deoxyribonucleotidase
MNSRLPGLSRVPGRVAFDIDGVFGNVMELFIRLARDLYQIDSIHYGDITRYYLYDCLDLDSGIIDRLIEKIVDYPDALKMNPFEQAVPVLSAYGQRYPLTFITARQKAEPITDWVLGQLPDVDPLRIRVIATGEHQLKLKILQELGYPYYIDDHLDTCHLLFQHAILPIVFEQPWNQEPHPFPKVANWRELGEILLAQPD